MKLAQIEVNLVILIYKKSNEQNLDKLKGQSCKGLLSGSKEVMVKHTDRKTDRENKNRVPSNLWQEWYSREKGPMILFQIISIFLYSIFLLCYISLKCIFPNQI